MSVKSRNQARENGIKSRENRIFIDGACVFRPKVLLLLPVRRDGREAEGDGLLNRYTGSNPYPGFESPSLRLPARL